MPRNRPAAARTALSLVGAALSLLALTACADDNGKGSSRPPSAAAASGASGGAGSVNCAAPAPGTSQDSWFAQCGPAQTSGPANTAPVGGWVALPNGVAVSIARVEPVPAPVAAQPGTTPALVTLTVTNRSTAPYPTSGIAIREMGRVDGTRATPVTHPQLPQQELPATIAPGQSAFTQQLFDVPDALRAGFRIIVAMTPEPSALPDATFTGTLTASSSSTP
ncbi:hypothetical protein [Streptodolium elevatio]